MKAPNEVHLMMGGVVLILIKVTIGIVFAFAVIVTKIRRFHVKIEYEWYLRANGLIHGQMA
jgi:hypothetical protein